MREWCCVVEVTVASRANVVSDRHQHTNFDFLAARNTNIVTAKMARVVSVLRTDMTESMQVSASVLVLVVADVYLRDFVGSSSSGLYNR